MDRYGARGELLAAQHETILGPFLVGPGVDKAFEFNLDGSTTVYEHGRTYVEQYDKERYMLSRDEYCSCMADHFYGGWYHDSPDSFFTDIETMKSKACKWDLSPEWSAWLSWAHKIVLEIQQEKE
jgi:hypothetical protein